MGVYRLMKFNSTRNKYKSIYIRTEENEEEVERLVKAKVNFSQIDFQKKIVKIPVFSGLIEIEDEGMGG